MNTTITKNRTDIPEKYKWDIRAMYADDEDVLKDIAAGLAKAAELAALKGHVMDSPGSLLNALLLYTGASRLIEKAYAYSHMRHDEDNSLTSYTELYGRASSAVTAYNAAVSFLEPEILAADPQLTYSYIAEEQGLEMFRFMLTELLKNSAHTLTADQEMVIASYSEVLRAPGDVFSALNILDLDFGTIRDAGGNEVGLTPASYIHHMESSSREVRKAAYTALYNEYKAHNNTMAAIYSANVRKDAVTARLRRYSSSLQAALAPDSIPESVYDNLVSAVREHLPSMHRYVRARKKLLGLDKMYMYDIYNPLFALDNTSYSFEEAVELISKALAPMGEEYVSVLRHGLTEERWADVYENTGKTSGAYSYGSYDSRPYILMNYGGGLRDVLTLIHESGHSMHSYYTRQTQPYIYGGHSIFTAEVASTVNETLLLRYLLENTEEPETEAYLINLYIDQFKGTLFRQTMFAEFERSAHEYVEAGEPLTAEWLNTEYGKLNAEYFGDSIEHDNLIQYEWSRIPHFYRSYYVYQYATGFSAANAIAGRLLGGDPDASADYIRFLRSGSSDTPVRLLQLAGADMSSAGPVGQALKVFDSLTERLAEIAGKK